MGSMRRFLAILLSSALVFTSLPNYALAEEVNNVVEPIEGDENGEKDKWEDTDTYGVKKGENTDVTPGEMPKEGEGENGISVLSMDDGVVEDISTGFIEPVINNPIESIYNEDSDVPVLYAASLPAKYVNENLTPLKDQNPYGTCWAFATMAMAEANLLTQNISKDLSELHLVYFSNNPVVDPLGGTAEDCEIFPNDMLYSGGNFDMATNSLMMWIGAVDEGVVPYSSAKQVEANGINSALAYQDSVHMVSSYEFNINSEREYAKRLILENGAIVASYHAENALIGSTSMSVYSSEHNSYYNQRQESPNHAIAIVGWDDNFSKNNFATAPMGDGAWLVKNSWTNADNSYNQYGYFWMSYYEATLEEHAYSFVFEPADVYDNNYQYDGGICSQYRYDLTGKYTGANIFTAKANETGEKLGAIAFETNNTNLNYTISVYTDLKDLNDPTSGKKAGVTTGKTTYAGYLRIDLAQEISLKANQTFSVVVELTKSNSNVSIAQEISYLGGGRSGYKCGSKNGQSFRYNTYRNKWEDLGTNGNFRIKAYTKNANIIDTPEESEEEVKEPTKITFTNVPQTGVEIEIGKSFVPNITYDPQILEGRTITFVSSNTKVATVSATGVVNAVGVGGATITVSTSDGGEAAFTVNVPYKLTSLKIAGETSLKVGDTFSYSCTHEPVTIELINKTVWSSNNEAVLKIDENGVATAISEGSAVIKAENDGVSDSILVNVIKSIPEESTIEEQNEKENIKALRTEGVHDVNYTGKAIVFNDLSVYFGDKLLVAGSDYTVAYKNNKNAGTATIIVSGRGCYSGTLIEEFVINKLDIANADSNVLVTSFSNKIQKLEPVISYKNDDLSLILKKNADYTISYPGTDRNKADYNADAFKAVGTYGITIIGRGNFTGSCIVNEKICADNALIPMSKVIVSKLEAKTYTGDEITQDSVLTYKGTTLESAGENADYTVRYINNVNVGTATVIYTGTGLKFKGEIKKSFNINGVALNTVNFGSANTVVYKGSAYTYDEVGLSIPSGVTCDVTYSKNINAGTGTVYFTGKGIYTGTVRKNFNITKCNINSVGGIPGDRAITVAYTRSGARPTSGDIKLNYIGKPLVENVDYALNCYNNSSAGNGAYCIITGRGNYTGNKTVYYNITPKDIINVTMTIPDKPYSTKKKGYISVPVLIDGSTLKAGTDYEKAVYYYYDYSCTKPVGEKDIPAVGTNIYVKVTAKGNNYIGTKIKSYKIVADKKAVVCRDISKASISVPQKIYTGDAITIDKSDILISINKEPVSSLDYEIVESSYRNNVNRGAGYFVVRGVESRGYSGEKMVKFSIVSRPIGCTVVFKGNGATSGNMKMYTLKKGKDGYLPQNKFALKGKSFVGWKDVKGNTYSDKAEFKNAGEGTIIYLYAQWR